MLLSAYLSKDLNTSIFTQWQVKLDGSIDQVIAPALKTNATKEYTNADLTGRYWFRKLAIVDMESSSRQASVRNGNIDFSGN